MTPSTNDQDFTSSEYTHPPSEETVLHRGLVSNCIGSTPMEYYSNLEDVSSDDEDVCDVDHQSHKGQGYSERAEFGEMSDVIRADCDWFEDADDEREEDEFDGIEEEEYDDYDDEDAYYDIVSLEESEDEGEEAVFDRDEDNYTIFSEELYISSCEETNSSSFEECETDSDFEAVSQLTKEHKEHTETACDEDIEVISISSGSDEEDDTEQRSEKTKLHAPPNHRSLIEIEGREDAFAKWLRLSGRVGHN